MWVRDIPSSIPRVQNLRSWPVAAFSAIRIYYALEADAMHIIRILHGKRDVTRIFKVNERAGLRLEAMDRTPHCLT